jgi:hypothetical protein
MKLAVEFISLGKPNYKCKGKTDKISSHMKILAIPKIIVFFLHNIVSYIKVESCEQEIASELSSSLNCRLLPK